MQVLCVSVCVCVCVWVSTYAVPIGHEDGSPGAACRIQRAGNRGCLAVRDTLGVLKGTLAVLQGFSAGGRSGRGE